MNIANLTLIAAPALLSSLTLSEPSSLALGTSDRYIGH